MKKIVLSIGILLILPFMMIACGNDDLDLSQIDIEAIDRFDVPAGTYTIQYTIEELSDLVKNHGALVSIFVKNSQNEDVTVTGNTFTVEANEVYTVTIKLIVEDAFKEKTFTVTAVLNTTAVLVTFDLKGGTGDFPVLTVDHGSSLTLTVEPTRDGFIFGGWYLDENYETPYTNQAINQHQTLYAKWELVVVSKVAVSFSLEGGIGDFDDQVIPMGSYALRPNEEPTKDGFIFLGWFLSLESSQPFDFATTMIYSDTVIYAKWEEVNTNTHKVTYHLNGAIQLEPITEMVNEGESPKGLDTQVSYEHHLFMGWSLNANDEKATPLNEILVLDDITLYAIWHIDFRVIDDTTYFTEYIKTDASTINEGFVEQRYNLRQTMRLGYAETTASIDENRVDYGILYSTTSNQPSYYQDDTKRHALLFDDYGMNDALPIAQVTTLPLLSDTTYYVVFFARYEYTILYSEIHEIKTRILVPEGSVVGADGILSGGYYKLDTINTNFRPSIFITVLEGFEASVDDISYSNYSELYREGIRRFVTKEISSGKEYLHVFHLEFERLTASLTFTEFSLNGEAFIPKFRAVFPFDEDIHYSVSEVGVLYSRDHPFLKIDMPFTSKKTASFDDEMMYFETNNEIIGNKEDVYIRAYLIVNNKVSYARFIQRLVFDQLENAYNIVEEIDTVYEKVSPEYGISAYYTPSTMRVYKVQGLDLIYVDYPNSFEIKEEGQYFVRNINGSGMVYDYLIIDDFPDVVGVSDLGQYVDSVEISYDMYSPYWYYSKDGGDYQYLPAKIRLSTPGYYEIFYRTGEGIEKISFEIVSEVSE